MINHRLLILWDIDGTLISLPKKRSNRHLRAVEQYSKKILYDVGSSLGKTDIGIIKDIFEFNKIDFTKHDLESCLEILNKMSVKEISSSTHQVNPGIRDALDFCDDIGAVNSLLTGNTKIRSLHKLQMAGLLAKFKSRFGFFGENFFSRDHLVNSAKEYAKKSQKYKIVLIGDTLIDIKAAHINDVTIFSVATGLESYSSLYNLNPRLIVEDLNRGKEYFINQIMNLTK